MTKSHSRSDSLASPLMYGVVFHSRPGISAAPNLRSTPPRPSSRPTPHHHFEVSRLWRLALAFVIYIRTLGKIRRQGCPESVQDQTSKSDISPPREYEWRSEMNALVSLTCALLLVHYSHFRQRAHIPRGCSIRPGRGERGSEGSCRWIPLPSPSSLMPRARKSLCLESCSGAVRVNLSAFIHIFSIYIFIYIHNIYFCFVFPQNLSANGGNKMESAPVRGKAAPCTGMINIPARLAAHHCSGTLASPLTAGTGPSETTAGWRNGRSQDFNWRSLSKRTEALFFFPQTGVYSEITEFWPPKKGCFSVGRAVPVSGCWSSALTLS